MHRHTDWLTHRQINGHKKERKPKTPTLLSMLVAQRLSIWVYMRYGGCHPKGLIVAS